MGLEIIVCSYLLAVMATLGKDQMNCVHYLKFSQQAYYISANLKMPLNLRHITILHNQKKQREEKHCQLNWFIVRHIQVLEMLKCEENQ